MQLHTECKMNTRKNFKTYSLALLTLVGFNVAAATPPLTVDSITKPAIVQGRLINPTANPIKPNFPPVTLGFNQNSRLVLDGHGGNMVTSETPLSKLIFKTNNEDYTLLKQYLSDNSLPAKNIIHSQHLLNSFQYDFLHYQQLSKNYAMHTELAPSPYNQDTLLLLIQVKLTNEASDKAKFGFQYLQAHLMFNPRLISEYRLVGFEINYNNGEPDTRSRTNNTLSPISINQYGQYTALYELRENEHAHDTDKQSIQPADNQQSISNRFSAINLAELSLQDARSSSNQQFVSHVEISMEQTGKFFEQASENFRFAAAVAGLSQLINANNYVHQFDYNDVISIATESKGEAFQAEREAFITLAKKVFEASRNQPRNKQKPLLI